MAKEFKFFINVDHCIEEYNYDFFFYENCSSRKKLLKVYLDAQSGKSNSFEKEAYDIAAQVRRFAYKIDEFQIVYAIKLNEVPANEPLEWEETLFNSLLAIYTSLRNARILYEDIDNAFCCVSLFVLCEYIGTPPDDFLTERLNQEINLIEKRWKRFNEGNSQGSVLDAFFSSIKSYYDDVESINLSNYLNEVILSNFLINVLPIDSNWPDEKNAAILRIIKYINSSPVVDDQEVNDYKTICGTHWEAIEDLPRLDIEKEYSIVLSNYKKRLVDYVSAATDISAPGENKSGYVSIPDWKNNMPNSMSIFIENDSYNQSDLHADTSVKHPDDIIADFEAGLSSYKTLKSDWEQAYSELMKCARHWTIKISEHEASLRNKYTKTISGRKQALKSNALYLTDNNTEKELNDLWIKRAEILQDLEKSQVAPKMKIQNQTALENEIEKENARIIFLIDCLVSKSAKVYFLLLMLLSVMITVLYLLFQFKVFFSVNAVFALAYIFIVALLMSFAWILPGKHFEKKITERLNELRENIKEPLEDYQKYIDTINQYAVLSSQLDYVERHILIRANALKEENMRKDARFFYRTKALEHIEKLNFFADLIRQNNIQMIKQSEYPPISSKGPYVDCSDCPLFWP